MKKPKVAKNKNCEEIPTSTLTEEIADKVGKVEQEWIRGKYKETKTQWWKKNA